MKPTRPTLFRAATASAMALIASPSLHSASGSWNVNAAGNWSAGANWTPAVVPGGTPGDIVNLKFNIFAARTVTIDGSSRTIGHLNIGETEPNLFAYTLASATPASIFLVMDAASGPATIDFQGTGANAAVNTISTGITLSDNLVVRSDTSVQHVLSGVINDGASSFGITYNNDVNGVSNPQAIVRGQFSVTGANTYDGGTTIEDARVATAAAGAFGTGAITIQGAGQAYFTGGSRANNLTLNSTGWVENAGNLGALRLENATVSGSVTLLQNTLIGNNANNTGTLSGAITGAFDITKVAGTATGPQGTLLLSGNNAGWSGNLTVNKGTVRFGTANSQGTGSTILVDGNASAVTNGSALELAGTASYGSSKTLTLRSGPASANTRASLVSQAGNNTWEGPIVIESTAAYGSLHQITATGGLTINNSVTAASPTLFPDLLFFRGGSTAGIVGATAVINVPNTDFAKTDGGAWTINSTGNNWDATLIADGTINLGANDALDTTAPLVLGQGSATTGQLDLKGFNQTVDSFHSDLRSTSAGLIIKNTGVSASTLTFTTDNGDTVLLGGLNQAANAFKGTLSGNVSLVKNGAAAFTLNSTTPSVVVPAWTGGSISVNGGSFALTGSVALGDATTSVNVNSGATFSSLPNLGGSVNVADGATLSGEFGIGANLAFGTTTGSTLVIDPSTAGALTVTGTATLNANVTVALSGPAPTSGTIRVLNVPVAPSGTGSFVAPGGFRTPVFAFNAGGTPGVDMTYSVASLSWNGAAGPTWDAGSSASWFDTANSTYFNGDTVTLGDLPAANQTIAVVGQLQPASLVFDSTFNYVLTGTAGSKVDAPLTKNNTGTLTIAFDNASSQIATVNAGTLQLGNGGTTGSLLGPIVNNAAVVLNHGTGANVTVPGPITGTGTLAKTGAGTTNLSSATASSYIGATSVTQGTLAVNQAGGLTATSGVSVDAGATLRLYSGNANFTFNRDLTGAGTVVIDPNASGLPGSRDITFSGNNAAFTGTVSLSPTGNGSVLTSGSFRTVSATAQANLGSGSIVVGNGGQLWFTGSLTNNLTLAGAGYSETAGGPVATISVGADGSSPALPTFAYSGIGAVRMPDAGVISGNVTLTGDAKIMPYSGTGTITGNVTNTNSTDTLVVGGGGALSTLILTGDNSGLERIWVNGGGSTGLNTLQIGTGGTTGTLGSGDVILYTDGASSQLRIDRSDSFTLGAGQEILAAHNGTASNLTKATVSLNVSGTGFDNAGNTIDLSDGTNRGTLQVGTAVANATTRLTGTIDVGQVTIGVLNATLPTTGATLSFGAADGSVTTTVTTGAISLAAGGNTAPLGNTAGAVLNIHGGVTLTANGLFQLGEQNNSGATVNQFAGSSVSAPHLRIGHWGAETSAYNLSGGSLNITGDASVILTNPSNNQPEQNGGIYVGVDAQGVFNQSGGTVSTNWIVLDNRGDSVAGVNMATGIDQYNLSAGTLDIRGSYGIIGRNASTVLNLSGGTVQITGTGLDVPVNVVSNVTGTINLSTNGATNKFSLMNDVLGSGTLALSGGGLIELEPDSNTTRTGTSTGTGTQVISAVLTGTSAVTKLGTGTTTLSGANTYAGATAVSAGRLNITGSVTSSVTVADSASFGGEGTVPSLTLGASGGSTLGISGDTVGALTVGALTANGTVNVNLDSLSDTAGVLTVVNYTTFTGNVSQFALVNAANYRSASFVDTGSAITLNPGNLALVWTGATNAIWSLNTDENFTDGSPQKFFSGDAVTFNDTGVNPVITLAGSLQPSLLTVDSSSVAYSLTASTGNVVAGPGDLLKKGSSILTMAGNIANTYTGGTVISQGSVHIQNAGSLGTANVVIGNGDTGSANTALYLDTNRISFARTVTVSNNGTGTATLGTRATVAGTGDNNNFLGVVLARDVVFDSNAADRTDYRNVTGTGNITVNGIGRTVLGGTNTFVGNVTVSVGVGGTLQSGVATAGNTNFIPDTSSLTVNDAPGNTVAEFRLSSGGETIAGLSGDGTLDVNAISGVLTVGSGDASSSFSGVLQNGGAFTLGLTKIGTGTLTLSGASTTTGAFTVSAGTLAATAFNEAAAAGPLGQGTVTVNGGTLAYTGATSSSGRAIALGASGGAVSVTDAGANLTLTSAFTANALTKSGAGTLTLGATNTHATTTVLGGRLVPATATSLGAGSVTVTGGSLDLNGLTLPAANTVAVGASGTLTGAGTFTAASAVAGTLNPGGTGVAGRIISVGNLTLAASAVMNLEIGGTAGGSFDVVESQAAVALAGTVNVSLINGFTPALNDSFDLIMDDVGQSGSVTLNLPALGSGLVWNTSAFATTGVVSVISDPLPAWAAGFSLFGNDALPGADPDGDGITNAMEYALGISPNSNNGPEYRGVASTTAGALTLTYRRPTTLPAGLTASSYVVQINTVGLSGQSNWVNASEGSDYSENITDLGGNVSQVTITFTGAVSGKKFARIFVNY